MWFFVPVDPRNLFTGFHGQGLGIEGKSLISICDFALAALPAESLHLVSVREEREMQESDAEQQVP